MFSKSAFTLGALAFASLSNAVNVDCIVNGDNVATVDLDTGACPFTLPDFLPVSAIFVDETDFDIEFYYATVGTVRFFTDIVNAGRVISIPAIQLFGAPGAPLFQVHAQKTPGTNSTAAIKKRFGLEQRATIPADLLAQLEAEDGVPAPGPNGGNLSPITLTVELSKNQSSSAASSGAPATTSPASSASDATATATDLSTTYVTITSCSDNKCHKSSIPVTQYTTTTTISGEETIYTTYCPLTESTYTKPYSSKPYTSEGSTYYTTYYTTYTSAVPVFTETVPAPPAPSPKSEEEVTTTYTSEGSTYTSVYTTTVAPATTEEEATTVAPVAPSVTTVVPETTTALPTQPAVTTAANAAGKFAPALALLAVPALALL